MESTLVRGELNKMGPSYWTLLVFLFLINYFLVLCLLFLHYFDTNNNVAEVVANPGSFLSLSYYLLTVRPALRPPRLNADSFLCPCGKPLFFKLNKLLLGDPLLLFCTTCLFAPFSQIIKTSIFFSPFRRSTFLVSQQQSYSGLRSDPDDHT